MSDQTQQSSTASASTLLLVLVALGGGWLLIDRPLESTRPRIEAVSAEEAVSTEDVAARLWQDPLYAVARHRENLEASDADGKHRDVHRIERLAAEIARRAAAHDEPERLMLLPVLVGGAPFPEDAERRRRYRYSMLSALGTAGYIPESKEQIGYVDAVWTKRPGSPEASTLGVAVPFEWFELDGARGSAREGIEEVLLLWVDEAELGGRPLLQVGCLLGALLGHRDEAGPGGSDGRQEAPAASAVTLAMVGPANSGTLLNMLREPARDEAASGAEERCGQLDALRSPVSAEESEEMSESADARRRAEVRERAFRLLERVHRHLDDGLPTRRSSAVAVRKLHRGAPEQPRPQSATEEKMREDLAGILERCPGGCEDLLARTLEQLLPDVRDSDPRWARTAVERWRDEEESRASEGGDPEAEAGSEGESGIEGAPPGWIEPLAPEDVLGRLEVFSARSTAPARTLLRIVERAEPSAESADRAERSAESADRAEPSVKSVERAPEEALRDAMEERVGGFHSTVVRDDHLARAVTAELARRGIDLVEREDVHVALVGEWDSAYGRALPRAFLDALVERACGAGEDGGSERCRRERREGAGALAARIHRFSYLRGLDGVAPREDVHLDGTTGGPRSGAAPRDSRPGSRAGARSREEPFGPGQLDYLRRLASQLEGLRRRLRDVDRGEILAVGVLGSDFYDKQLILQALRPQFPRAVFFTHDLDARFGHGSRQRWNRNLIVASSFGLKLHPGVQHDIPPFRDSYQVASYLAGLLAVKSGSVRVANGTGAVEPGDFTPSQLLGPVSLGPPAGEPETATFVPLDALPGQLHPQLFEIGRRGPVDLTPHEAKGAFHPRPRDSRPSRSWTWSAVRWVGLLLLGVVLLAAPTADLRRRLSERPETIDEDDETAMKVYRWERGGWIRIAIFGCLTLALLLFAILRSHFSSGGEPFALAGGISIWPTEILRWLAMLLSLVLLWWSLVSLRASKLRLARRYGLPPCESDPPPGLWERTKQLWEAGRARWSRRRSDEPPRGRGEGARGLRALRERWAAVRLSRLPQAEGATLPGQELWRVYCDLGRPGSRFVRLLGPLVAYLLLAVCLTSLLGSPHRPFRGEIAETADRLVLLGSVLAFQLLVFFVIDASRLSHRFIRRIGDSRTAWPLCARSEIAERYGLDPDDPETNDVLDIRIIAQRSETTARLVLYPFLVLALMAVSRSPLFDAWDWPLSLILVLGLIAAAAIGSGVALRRSAERARRRVVERLRQGLARRSAGPEAERGKAEVLRELVHEVETLSRGAFAPWRRHPVVQALLLPFSGIGLVTLFELLTRLGPLSEL